MVKRRGSVGNDNRLESFTLLGSDEQGLQGFRRGGPEVAFLVPVWYLPN